jgi:hypothetical protein
MNAWGRAPGLHQIEVKAKLSGDKVTLRASEQRQSHGSSDGRIFFCAGPAHKSVRLS